MKKSIIYAISASIIVMLPLGCSGEITYDLSSYEIPIIKEITLEGSNITTCQFSKNTKRIWIWCGQGQDSTYHLFDIDSDQVKDITYYQAKSYAFLDHQIDPCYECIIYMIPDLRDDGSPRKLALNFVSQQPPLGDRQLQPGYNFSNPQPEPENPVRPFKIVNLWEDTEITLIRGANKEPIDFFDVKFDNLKSEIWIRDREPGIGHRYGYWQLYDTSGKSLQKYPGDLNGFARCNILRGNPITSPDGSKVAFTVGSHYTLASIGQMENDICFIMVCDRKTGKCLAQIPVDTPQISIRRLPHNGIFSNDSRSLFVQDSPWQISLVDIETQLIEQMFNIRKVFPNCFHTIRMNERMPDGNLVIETTPTSVIESEIPRAIVWDGKLGEIIQTSDSDLSSIHRDRISPDGRTVLCLDRLETETDKETGEMKEIRSIRKLTFRDAKTEKILAAQDVPANGRIMPVEISDDWSKMVGYGKDKMIVYDISGIINRP